MTDPTVIESHDQHEHEEAARFRQLHEVLAAGDEAQLAAELAGVDAADIAEFFDLLDDDERSRVLYALPPRTAAEVVIALDEAVRGDVVEELEPEQLSDMVSELPVDDAADLLGELPQAETADILTRLPEDLSDKLEALLVYSPETAGGIMTTDVVSVPRTGTVLEAREAIRAARRDEDKGDIADDLTEVYVIDDEGRPIGTVPIHRLVTHRSGTPVEGIYDPDPLTVPADADQEDVLHQIHKYAVSAAAVVDARQRLIGRITYDDLMDVAREEHDEDVLRLAGTDPAELRTSSILRAAGTRLTWLVPCLFGTLGTATALMLGKKSLDIEAFAALSPFVPMIGAMGGNSGVQTSTVVVRGLVTGELAASRLSRALLREGRIALTMAPICGGLAWLLVTLCLPLLGLTSGGSLSPMRVAFAVGVAMSLAVVVAAFLGIMLPFTFHRLDKDPAIASGPVVTTLNDMISVSAYLLIALSLAR